MNKADSLRIDRTAFSVQPLGTPSGDKEYWLSRSPYKRLQMVETLRQLNYGHDTCTARLRRVLEIAQR